MGAISVKIRSDSIVLTEDQKDFALEEMVKGKGADSVAKALGFSMRSLSRIMGRDPVFAKEMAKAREVWTHSMVETLIGITKNCHTMAEVSAAKVESENIKWVSGKYIPEIYGDRIDINMNHHLDLSSILLAAEDRVLPILQAKQALLTGSAPSIDVESRPITDSGEPNFENSDDLMNSGSIPDELKDLI